MLLLGVAVLVALLMIVAFLIPADTVPIMRAYSHAFEHPGEAADREIAAAEHSYQLRTIRIELVFAAICGGALYGFIKLRREPPQII